MAKKGKTGMGKAIGKLIAMAKKEAGNLKEQAKVAAKQKINELEDEIREKLPTKEEIQDRILHEIETRGKPVACSLRNQNLMEQAYNKFKDLTGKLDTKALAASVALNAIINKSSVIENVITMVEGFLDIIETIVDILSTILNLLAKALTGLLTSDLIPKPPFTPGFLTFYETVAKALTAANFLVSSIEMVPEAALKVIRFIRKNVDKIINILAKILEIITKVLAFIAMINIAVEAAYLIYLNFCNVSPEDNLEDAFTSDELSNALTNPNLNRPELNSLYEQTVLDLQNLGKKEVIRKIYDADMRMVAYKRYKSNDSLTNFYRSFKNVPRRLGATLNLNRDPLKGDYGTLG